MSFTRLTWSVGLCLLATAAFGQQLPRKASNNEREKWLAEMLKEPVEKRVLVQPVIKNEKMAVAIAEAYALSVYGEKLIKEQRPYYTKLINGYWVVNGRLREGWDGGVFEIVLDGKDGRVVRFLHGQ